MTPDGRENKPRLFKDREQKQRATKIEPSKERTEYHPTKAAIIDMHDFFDFADTPAIQKELDRGSSLSDAIYDRFYSENPGTQKYQENDPHYQALAESFNRQMDQVENWCRSMQEWSLEQKDDPMSFYISENGLENGWMYIKTHRGIDSSQPIGRIYLNLKPGAAPDFYMRTAEQILKKGAKADLKIGREASLEDFNRPDKVVMYFNEADQDKILDTIRSYYDEKPGAFDEGTPRFTAELAN